MTATPVLAHVVFQTRQFEAMLDWYDQVFGAKPVGVNFDPEALLEQFEAGASEAELLAMLDGPIAPIPPLQH